MPDRALRLAALVTLLAALAWPLGLATPAVPQAQAAQAKKSAPIFNYVHFLVIAAEPLNKADRATALQDLRERLAYIAGGYTELGQASGASLESGQLVNRENIAFLVAGSRDLRREISLAVYEAWGDDRPFILVWPAAGGPTQVPIAKP